MKRGFTLVELLVSISIIALITIASAAVYIQSLRRARDVQRLADMAAIGTALESYYADHNRYPGPPDGVPLTGQYIGNGCPIDTALEPYMDTIPRDPLMEETGCNTYDPDEDYAYAYDPNHHYNPPISDTVGEFANCGPGTSAATNPALNPAYPGHVITYGFRTAEILTDLHRDTCNGDHFGMFEYDYIKAEHPASL